MESLGENVNIGECVWVVLGLCFTWWLAVKALVRCNRVSRCWPC